MIPVTCPDKTALVETEIDRVLTQYRESTYFLFMIRTYLGHVADVLNEICIIPQFFDLYDAVGDQLTLLGQRLGWPRTHCVCATQPVFGFDCDPVVTTTQELMRPIGGFCDGAVTWEDCGPFGLSDITLNDDELYRKFLMVRRYQYLCLYDIDSLNEAVKIFWGPTATVLDAGHGRVVVAPGRPLTAEERAVLSLYPRVLPVALGIKVRFHFDMVPVFGMEEGWLGFCQPYDYGAVNIVTEYGALLVTQTGAEIVTGLLVEDPIWMCEVDVDPYDCNVRQI
jgi:hypothetical protein